ncbi:MAG: hypothetical protein O2888_02325, partial [Chloroflexi bacterium]|nr:hypothetical protein [Chloroflexota bacterium]
MVEEGSPLAKRPVRRTSLPIFLAMALLLALVVGDLRSARADGAPEEQTHSHDDTRMTLTSSPIKAQRGLPEPAPQIAGTFGGTLPRHGGTAFVTWNGGSIGQLLAAAGQQGCAARSVWALVDGRFVGYRAGAPTFVNAQWQGQYPGDIPR